MPITRPGDTGSVSTWLRGETPELLSLLTKLRTRLERRLEASKNPDAVPDRDWCRGFQRYQTGYAALLAEERERAKLALMARLKGQGKVLTDEEYEAGIRELALESLGSLPAEDLARELERRGLKLPAVAAEPDDE